VSRDKVLAAGATLAGSREPGQAPVQAVVEEAAGQFQQEVPFHGRYGPLDVEAIVEAALEDGLADEVVVFGLGGDPGHARAKVLAAVAAGGVLGVEDVQPDDLPVGQRPNKAVLLVSAVTVAAARRAGIALGLAAHRHHPLSRLRLGPGPSRLAGCLSR
jgi:hypothetical protein